MHLPYKLNYLSLESQNPRGAKHNSATSITPAHLQGCGRQAGASPGAWTPASLAGAGARNPVSKRVER